MFSKNVHNLKEASSTVKIIVTAFLVLAGLGYLLGFFNVLLTYSPVDREPGLSLKDIEYSFYGKTDSTKLAKSIDGSMRKYFSSDDEYQVTKDWLDAGGAEDVFNTKVKPIFDYSCTTCHSPDTAMADVVTENYSDLTELLKVDSGKSVGRLVSISHTHLLATLAIIFILNLIFFQTGFSEVLKKIVACFSFGAILLDIGSWWLASLAPFFSILVVLGGATLGLSFLVLILLPLYEIFIMKKSS